MATPTPSPASHPDVDPERLRPDNPFDAADGMSGQEFSPERQQAQAARENADVAGAPVPVESGRDDIPPDAGRRAGFDRATGEVHGSGAGAGGGNPGEDYDPDAEGGDGVPITGADPAR